MSEFRAFLAKDRQKRNAEANQPPHTLCAQAKTWFLADSLPCCAVLQITAIVIVALL